MAQVSRKSIEGIIAKEMPGFRLARNGRIQTRTAATDVRPALAVGGTPEIGAIRGKLFGMPVEPAGQDGVTLRLSGSVSISSDSSLGTAEDVLVSVEPISASDDIPLAAQRKVIVISLNEGRIIGSQG